MIRLYPNPESLYKCLVCDVQLKSQGWYMPGMRVLADLKCEQCGREYYGDLQTGHGLYYPMLLDKATGEVYDEYNVGWFAEWLRDSYQDRTSEELSFTVEEFRPLRKVLVLNCLDVLYGHSLLKLLNAQYYLDHSPDFDLVVIVPAFMRWMVPDGVAAIWTVKLPLRRGTEWNDWLAGEFHRRLAEFDELWLSVAYAHPHGSHFDIKRFTHVTPFEIDAWRDKPEQPVVTFIWRDDRRWQGKGVASFVPAGPSWRSQLARKILHPVVRPAGLIHQQHKVIEVAEILRRNHPQLLFAVVGPGRPVGFPAWIQDKRTTQIDEKIERAWCQQYARSHVVVGVHGSNMLLPSAHAATLVNLLPQDRLGNAIQDILVTERDARMALARYRMIPLSTSVEGVAKMIEAILCTFHHYHTSMALQSVSHLSDTFPTLRRRF